MSDWMFGQSGKPEMLVDGDKFRDLTGCVVGWMHAGSVFTVLGRHHGWYEGGVLYDAANCAVGFIRSATGRIPSRPGLTSPPGRPGFPGAPGRPGLAGIPGRPGGNGGWSAIPLGSFFAR